MAVQKRNAKKKAKVALEQKFGARVAKEIVNKRKIQESKFERTTKGLDDGEVRKLEKQVKKHSHKGRKYLEKFAYKRKEDPKLALFCKGNKCSQSLGDVLDRMCQNRAPNAVRDLGKNKKDLHPIDDQAYLLNLMHSKKCHLTVMGSHTKKRPNTLTIARRYGEGILDMAELGVTNLIDHGQSTEIANAAKAIVITQGALWQGRYEMNTLKSLLTDLYYGYVPDEYFITGIERLVVLTALENEADPMECPSIRVSQFKMNYKAGPDAGAPLLDLVPIDFQYDLSLNRIKAADARVMTEALRVPREEHTAKSKKVSEKGMEKNELGDVIGKVHFKNDFDEIKTKVRF